MKKSTLIICIATLSLLVSCNNTPSVVKTEDVKYTTIIKDIKIQMPGNLYISNNCYIIEDPMNRKDMFMAYDKRDNSVIGNFCHRGNSSTEVVQGFSDMSNSNILVYDLNAPKYIRFSANEFGKIDDYGKSSVTKIMNSFCSIDDDHIV